MSRKVVEECDGCGFGPVEATASNVHHRKHAGLEDLWLCDVCRQTQCGNAALYDSAGYREDRNVLRTIAAATNMVLAAIRASGGQSDD